MTLRRDHMVQAREVMKQDGVSVQTGTPVVDAAKVMRERKIGGVFVKQNGRIVGIVTEPDIVRKVLGDGQGGYSIYFVRIDEIMSSLVICFDEHLRITHAVALIDWPQTRHLAASTVDGDKDVLSPQRP